MKRRSIITTLVSLGTVCFVAFGLAVFVFASRTFEEEITRLNERDYGERINNIEHEYQAVDAVSMASEEVERAQEELLERLHARYIRSEEELSAEGMEERTAHPFIFNGDGEFVLRLDDNPFSAKFAESEMAGRMIEEGTGSRTFERNGVELWVTYSYFEPWDWITGYVVENRTRLAAMRSFASSLIVAVAAGLVVIGLGYWAYVRRSLSPLTRMSEAMSELTDGDLHRRLEPRGNNEITDISERFNEFADHLTTIIRGIAEAAGHNRDVSDRLQKHSERSLEAAERISERAGGMKEAMGSLNGLTERSRARMEEVTTQVDELKSAVEEQFAAVTQSTAAAEEMSASLDNVARITRDKTESSARLGETVREGSEKLAGTRELVSDVNGRIDDISSLLSIIQNVAARTNLLSMNAAIEAAHAGEAGRGFAVVAAEIRKLAEETTENSKSISDNIGVIIERIRSIAASGAETGVAFASVESEVAEVSDSFNEIAQSADELASGSAQIRTAMGSLKDTSVRVKDGAEASRSAAQEIVAALVEVDQRASEVLEGISAVTEETDGSVEAMRRVAEEVEALRQSVAELNKTVEEFEL